MDDFPAESLVSASSIDEDPDTYAKRHARRDSTSSVGTVIQRRQENVLVCVRVRPPAVSHTQHNVNPAHLEEAWLTDTDSATIALGDGSSHQYHFGELQRSRFAK